MEREKGREREIQKKERTNEKENNRAPSTQ